MPVPALVALRPRRTARVMAVIDTRLVLWDRKEGPMQENGKVSLGQIERHGRGKTKTQ